MCVCVYISIYMNIIKHIIKFDGIDEKFSLLMYLERKSCRENLKVM